MAYPKRSVIILEQQKKNWEEVEDLLRAAQYGDTDQDVKLSLAEALARVIQMRVTVTRHLSHMFKMGSDD